MNTNCEYMDLGLSSTPLVPNQTVQPSFFRGKCERNMYAMYAEDDISRRDLFAGGYISYGFWEKMSTFPGALSIGDRIQSQQTMYSLTFAEAAIRARDVVLEIGSARGFGAVQCLMECQPSQVIGIDIMPVQVCRAIATQGQCERLRFCLGAAEAIPLPDCSVTKLISLDVVHHLHSISAFAKEAYRVLEVDGRLTFGAMFGRTACAERLASKFIQTIAVGIDHVHLISDVVGELEGAGFGKVQVNCIGQYVWEGYDRWMSQGEYADSWGRDWYRIWQGGFIDYCLMTADKLSGG